MRIWVTGSAGFLGNRLAARLSSAGHEVVGLSRRASRFGGPAIEIDLGATGARDRLCALSREMGPPEAVVHAASRQPGEKGLLADYVRSNVLATANLLDALRETPARQLIYTSTLSVYGRPQANPVRETEPARGPLPYAATKRWSEQLVETLQDQSQVVVLRLPSMYGAGQVDSFVDGLARTALGDEPIELFGRGELVRDCLYVEDVVRAIVSCLERPPSPRFSCMNLGCGRAIRTREYAEALVAALGSRSEIVAVDRPVSQFDLHADIEEARRLIGFRPSELEHSMREYADELRA